MALRPSISLRPALRSAGLGAFLLACAGGGLAACGDDEKGGGSTEQGADGGTDGGSASEQDGATDAPPGDQDAGGDGDSGSEPVEADGGDAGCSGSGCSALDPRVPFALRCDNLPQNSRCAGGPREVLLVAEDTGWIVMFDPEDGHFLGYFKRPNTSYTVDSHAGYRQATQGPDQCIWTVSEDDDLQVERWDTDGTYIGPALEPHTLPVTDAPPDPAVQSPTSLAFTADRVYVASSSGYPEPRVTRWTLDGQFDRVVLDDGTEANFVEVLGDGSLLVSDNTTSSLRRYPADGSKPEKVSSTDMQWPQQVAYLGDSKVVVADQSFGEPFRIFDMATGMAESVSPYPPTTNNTRGVAPLRNGRWLITGGDFTVSVLDPNSAGTPGQYGAPFDDGAIDGRDFNFIGRACLSDEFLASRAGTAPVTSCTVPAGPAILEENFESGTFSTDATPAFKGFRSRGGATLSFETPEAAGSTRSLKIEGGTSTSFNGVRMTFPSAIKPSYVSYRVRALHDEDFRIARENNLGRFTLTNSVVVRTIGSYPRPIDPYIFNDYLNAGNANANAGQTLGAWKRVELRNIDWDARTLDFYVDCVRYAEGVSLPAGYGDDVDTLDLYNYVGTASPNNVVWFDDIVIK